MSRTAKTVPAPSKPSTTVGKTATLTLKDRLHPEDLEQLRATFDLFDADHSGFIDPE